MDWVSKGFQPGFPELVTQHLGAIKAEKVLQALALAKIFTLTQLKSSAPSGGRQRNKTESLDGDTEY